MSGSLPFAMISTLVGSLSGSAQSGANGAFSGGGFFLPQLTGYSLSASHSFRDYMPSPRAHDAAMMAEPAPAPSALANLDTMLPIAGKLKSGEDKGPMSVEEALLSQHMGLYMGLVSLYETPETQAKNKLKKSMLCCDAKELRIDDLISLQQLVPHPLPTALPLNVAVPQPQEVPQAHYTSLGVSKGLQKLLDEGFKSQRPVRVDINDNASVILKMGRDGLVSAEFLTANQWADWYFRHNLSSLKQALDAKQLPVGQLTVRQEERQPNQEESANDS